MNRWRWASLMGSHSEMLIDENLTGTVIGASHRVFNVLGPGLPESVYVGALKLECEKRGLHVAREYPIAVYYDDVIVGSYRADLLVERRLIVEVKACPYHDAHGAQALTYLRCSEIELGLVISFDTKPLVKRFIMRNGVKRHLSILASGPRDSRAPRYLPTG